MDMEQESGAENPTRHHWTLQEITAALSIFLVGFTAVAIFCLGVMDVNSSIPRFFGGCLVVLATPWEPLLDKLGLLAKGEWFSFPSLWGILLVVAIYLVLLNIPNAIATLFRRKARSRHPMGGVTS